MQPETLNRIAQGLRQAVEGLHELRVQWPPEHKQLGALEEKTMDVLVAFQNLRLKALREKKP